MLNVIDDIAVLHCCYIANDQYIKNKAIVWSYKEKNLENFIHRLRNSQLVTFNKTPMTRVVRDNIVCFQQVMYYI